MARNLREKIHALVNDCYDLRKESIVTKIEALIKEELELRDEERLLSYHDLMVIQSDAGREFTSMRTDAEFLGKLAGDQPLFRTLCLVNAVTSFLRSKGLLSARLKYQK